MAVEKTGLWWKTGGGGHCVNGSGHGVNSGDSVPSLNGGHGAGDHGRHDNLLLWCYIEM